MNDFNGDEKCIQLIPTNVIVAAAVDAVVAVRKHTSRHDISVAQVRRVF
jgi:hypothetical protein